MGERDAGRAIGDERARISEGKEMRSKEERHEKKRL